MSNDVLPLIAIVIGIVIFPAIAAMLMLVNAVATRIQRPVCHNRRKEDRQHEQH